MKDPTRLTETNADAAYLLGAARDYRPCGKNRRRVATALGLSMTAGTASMVSVSAAAAGVAKGLASWKVATGLIFCATVAAGASAHRSFAPQQHPPVRAHIRLDSLQLSRAEFLPRSPVVPTEVALVAEEAGSAPREAIVRVAPTRRKQTSGASAANVKRAQIRLGSREPLDLKEGLAPVNFSARAQPSLNGALLGFDIIEDAERKLRSGHNADAASLAKRYLEAFPQGAFCEEAFLIGIQSSVLEGNFAAAETQAESFLRRHSRSLSTPKVRGLLRVAREGRSHDKQPTEDRE